MTIRNWFKRWLLGTSAFWTVHELPLAGIGNRFKKQRSEVTTNTEAAAKVGDAMKKLEEAEAVPPAAWDEPAPLPDEEEPEGEENRPPLPEYVIPASEPDENETVANAKVTGKPRKKELTPEQRERKNARDRARRAEQKAAKTGISIATA